MSNALRSNPAADFLRQLETNVSNEHDKSASNIAEARIIRPVDLAGGWSEILLDLSDTTKWPAELEGYSVAFCRDGSTAGAALAFDFGGGGKLQTVLPGNQYVGRFKALRVSLATSNAVIVGTARLLLTRNPQVAYKELPPNPNAGTLSEKLTIQAYNSLVNIPALVTDGLALNGARGVRVMVALRNTDTIVSGEIVLWHWDDALALWFETPVVDSLVTGRNGASTTDYTFTVPAGRVFAELRSFVSSVGTVDGTETPYVKLQLWGV